MSFEVVAVDGCASKLLGNLLPDDTLFPTTWSQGDGVLEECATGTYAETAQAAVALLRTARKLGQVVIDDPWHETENHRVPQGHENRQFLGN